MVPPPVVPPPVVPPPAGGKGTPVACLRTGGQLDTIVRVLAGTVTTELEIDTVTEFVTIVPNCVAVGVAWHAMMNKKIQTWRVYERRKIAGTKLKVLEKMDLRKE